MRIIGPPSAERSTVVELLTTRLGTHERFLTEMFEPLWNTALLHIIDPVGVIAQAWKETAGGRFTGRVRPEFHNTCGLKIRYANLYPGVTDDDQPLAHAMFASWNVGTTAHVQHLRAYAAWPIPTDALVVDPRYTYVIGRHACESFAELGGRWAPSPTYGVELESIARELQGR